MVVKKAFRCGPRQRHRNWACTYTRLWNNAQSNRAQVKCHSGTKLEHPPGGSGSEWADCCELCPVVLGKNQSKPFWPSTSAPHAHRLKNYLGTSVTHFAMRILRVELCKIVVRRNQQTILHPTALMNHDIVTNKCREWDTSPCYCVIGVEPKSILQ